jgi:hypothetical protein
VCSGSRLLSPAVRWQKSRTKPSAHKVDRGRTAFSTVNDGRAERRAANGVVKADRSTAQRERPDREPTDRDAEPQCSATQREDQTDGRSSNGDKTASNTGNRDTSDCYVPDRDNPVSHSRSHRGGVDAHADVYHRPAADAGARSVLESQNGSLLNAGAAHNSRGIAADALAADGLLANGTQSDCG